MRTETAVAIWLLVAAVLFAAASYVVRYRERSCETHCRSTGYAGYLYKGFTGGRLLSKDSCECVNAAIR